LSIKFWRYSIPPDKDGLDGWGIFLLDSTGFFSCVTDFGNYAFRWGTTGKNDFREFFLDESFDYHVRKLYFTNGNSFELDWTATVKNIKEWILRLRHEDSLTEDEASSEWDLINRLSDEDNENEWIENTTFTDAFEMLVYDLPISVRRLRDELMPRLRDAIKAELKKEKVTA
jgi:hypothetical protein